MSSLAHTSPSRPADQLRCLLWPPIVISYSTEVHTKTRLTPKVFSSFLFGLYGAKPYEARGKGFCSAPPYVSVFKSFEFNMYSTGSISFPRPAGCVVWLVWLVWLGCLALFLFYNNSLYWKTGILSTSQNITVESVNQGCQSAQ